MDDRNIARLISKYIKDGSTVAIGTSMLGEKFLKTLALEMEIKKMEIRIVPTSFRIAAVATSLGLKLASLNSEEVDVAIEFVDQVDEGFNYIKRHSHSLVRDKMIAQSAENLIVIGEKKGFVKILHGNIPFEICTFGNERTLGQLEKLGRARLRTKHSKPYKTETNHYFVDVDVDEVYSLEDLEYQAKEIPGVLETGLFVGYADTVVLYDDKTVKVRSRLTAK